ncbi:hypothetical protein K523DRAFT_365639 [Schizophyllum commune Tattone D]|nr:hypothetical protein K523DRAFT_365639 [Schizophyllum commune Tattone D]
MSWPAPYPPPPRRSRSRSPARGMAYNGARPPFPEQYPPPDFDPYYERERSYVPGAAPYDRPPYEYGGRRRSRSPGGDESRKRRRSASPYDRDRYEPRPRYADDYDTHSRSYDYRRRGYGGGRRPMDPRTADYPVSLRQYAEWFRYTYPDDAAEEDRLDKEAEAEAGDGSKPRNGLRTLWEKYKKEFAQNQLQIMFDHHKKSPWFAEKYDPAPEFEQMRQRLRKEGWKGRLAAFLDDLDAGEYDPETKEPEPTSPTTKESVNGDAESKAKPEANGEEDSQFPMDTEEDAGEDANRNNANGQSDAGKRPDQRDELEVPIEGNQVMIRTIPPDIGRTKLEENICHLHGYHYLALGDPLQKRNFYRAGWIRFTEDADMSTIMNELIDKKIDGFKLHVTHNQRPFTGKIRYAPEVASRPARLAKDLASARHLASLLEDQAATLRALKVKKPQPPKPEGAPAEGDEPLPEPEYDEEEEEPRERGTDAVERRIETIMQNLQEQGLVDSSNEKAYEEKKVVVSLDLFIAYLRAAFNTCFYCCVVTDHVEELQRKCVKHERKPLSAALVEELKAEEAEKEAQAKKAAQGGDEAMDVKEEGGQQEGEEKKEEGEGEKKREKRKDGGRDWKRNDERWLEWHDSKFALLVSRDEVDPREYGGKNYDEELSKTVEPYIKREEEHKFRCKSCQKLFKAASFVEKHVANKHPDLLKPLEELTYFNNFALDPHRIQPFSHPPPVSGNAPPPQAFGLPATAQYAQQPDYTRGGYPDTYGAPPPMYMNGRGGYDMPPYMGGAPGFGAFPPGPPGGGRRLAERVGGYAEPSMGLPPPGPGLPAKPMHLLEGPLMAGNVPMNGGMGGGRRGGRGGGPLGPPPPPPPDAKEDPRAARGARVSYHDMDEVAEGDIQLQY